jgi:hypothetical protein
VTPRPVTVYGGQLSEPPPGVHLLVGQVEGPEEGVEEAVDVVEEEGVAVELAGGLPSQLLDWCAPVGSGTHCEYQGLE